MRLGGDPIADALPASWLTVVILAAGGLVIEAPIYLIAFAGSKKRSARRVLGALLVGNLITNALLALYYSQAWETSLVDGTRVVGSVEVLDRPAPGDTWVYTIAPDQQSIRRCRLDGSADELVAQLTRAVPYGRLGVFGMPGEVRRLCLVVDGAESTGLPQWEPEPGLKREVWEDRFYEVAVLSDSARASVYSEEQISLPYFSTTATAPYGPAADLRLGELEFTVESTWEGLRGITLQYPDHEERLALDNPLIRRSMTPFSVSVLPGDLLVFELTYEGDPSPWGTYMLSVESGRVARLTRGRSPVVIIESSDSASL
jgi:hypothetical protein